MEGKRLYALFFTPMGPPLISYETVVLFRAKTHNQARIRAKQKCEDIGRRAQIQVRYLQCGRCRTEDLDLLLGRCISREEADRLFKPKRAVSFNPAHDYGRSVAEPG